MRPCSSWDNFLQLQNLAERRGFSVAENRVPGLGLSLTKISSEFESPSHYCDSIEEAMSFLAGYGKAKREDERHAGFDFVLQVLFMDDEDFNEDKEWDQDTLEHIASIVMASKEYKALVEEKKQAEEAEKSGM